MVSPYQVYLEMKQRAIKESTSEKHFYGICGDMGNGEEMYLLNYADEDEIKRVDLTESQIREMLKVMTKEQIIDGWFAKVKGELK